MRVMGNWLGRPVAVCLAMCLVAPFAAAATAPTQDAPPGQQVKGTNSTQSKPGTPDSSAPQGADSNRPPAPSQSAAEPQQNDTSNPVGTAAAPYEKPLGVAGSRPAGAVIAPAKQRRTRSILIKVSVIVAGAVAIGAVAALSKSSPSRPN